MHTVRARVLVVDDREGTLSVALSGALAGFDVETVHDVVEALYRIDCASRREFDLIFCDVARRDLSGPELWAYLSLDRRRAARRMVFVASGPLPPATRAFLAKVPNVCVELPLPCTEAAVERRVARIVRAVR